MEHPTASLQIAPKVMAVKRKIMVMLPDTLHVNPRQSPDRNLVTEKVGIEKFHVQARIGTLVRHDRIAVIGLAEADQAPVISTTKITLAIGDMREIIVARTTMIGIAVLGGTLPPVETVVNENPAITKEVVEIVVIRKVEIETEHAIEEHILRRDA